MNAMPDLINELSGERKSNIDFADVMEFQCKKYKDVNGVTLFIDYFTITFIRQKKVRDHEGCHG